jgi:Predicted transcriptional regulators
MCDLSHSKQLKKGAENMDRQKIGERLRLLRGNMTAEELGQRLGVTQQAISYYEKGQRIPRDEIKQEYARLFNVSVEEIFYT